MTGTRQRAKGIGGRHGLVDPKRQRITGLPSVVRKRTPRQMHHGVLADRRADIVQETHLERHSLDVGRRARRASVPLPHPGLSVPTLLRPAVSTLDVPAMMAVIGRR